MHLIEPLPPGLVAVVGDEQTGKTHCLRRLSGDLAQTPHDGQSRRDARWCDLGLPGRDQQTPAAYWAGQQAECPRWDGALASLLTEDLGLLPHTEKNLFMLSTGSRRKVALVGLLASGATVICLDQPYAALDQPSIQVVRTHLQTQALTQAQALAQAQAQAQAQTQGSNSLRTWVVADYVADPQLPWQRVVQLDRAFAAPFP